MNKIIKNKIVLLLCFLIAACLIFILADRYLKRKAVYDSLVAEFKTQDVEYGSKLTIPDLISKHNGQITDFDKLDTMTIGPQTLSFTLEAEEETYRQKVTRKIETVFNVVDTDPPHFELKDEVFRVYVGEELVLDDNIVRVYDTVDGPINGYAIVSDADSSVAGEYKATVSANDRNGLTGEKTFTVIVRNRPVSGGAGYDLIHDILTSTYGYSEAAACGILANIRFESNFTADVGDYYYGLCQWGGSRRDNLYSYCSTNGLDAATIEGQLAFMQSELTGAYSGVHDYLMNVEDSAQGAFAAGDYFCRYYEAAASADGRGDLAASYYGG